MVDHLTPAARSAVMRAVKGKHTAPELKVRRILHAAGFRFRVQWRFGRKHLDVAFTKRKQAILVHGCFWHGHDCARGHLPTTNAIWWSTKIGRNRERDRETMGTLAGAGWQCLVVWECELRDDDALLARLRSFLGPARCALPRYAAASSP